MTARLSEATRSRAPTLGLSHVGAQRRARSAHPTSAVVIECLGEEVGGGSTHRLVVVPGVGEKLRGDGRGHTDLDANELVRSVGAVPAGGPARARGTYPDVSGVLVHLILQAHCCSECLALAFIRCGWSDRCFGLLKRTSPVERVRDWSPHWVRATSFEATGVQGRSGMRIAEDEAAHCLD